MSKIMQKSLICKGIIVLGTLAITLSLAFPETVSAYWRTSYNFKQYEGYEGEYDYNYTGNVNSNKNTRNPLPYINSITPNYVTAGEMTNVIILGSGFTEASVAKFDGSARSTAFIDQSRLSVKLTAKDVSDSGRYYISVDNPAPGGGFSNPVPFNVKSSGTATQAKKTTTTSASSASAITAYQSASSPSDSAVDLNKYSYENQKEDFGDLTAGAITGSRSFLPTGILQWLAFIALVLAIIFVWRKFFGSEKVYHSSPLKHA